MKERLMEPIKNVEKINKEIDRESEKKERYRWMDGGMKGEVEIVSLELNILNVVIDGNNEKKYKKRR